MTRTKGPEQYDWRNEEKETLSAYAIAPYEVRDGDQYGYKVIAKIHWYDGTNGMWSAYKGLTHWTDGFTAAHGDKVSREVAQALFPTLFNVEGLRYDAG